jgi:glucosamine 6-phosphate synthetase-like amidotransferase/phosphosugar isomerase protein
MHESHHISLSSLSSSSILVALTAVLPLQLIGYELSLLKGINPDTPRNLVSKINLNSYSISDEMLLIVP